MARRGRLILIVDPDLDFVEDTRLLLSGERLLTARSLEEAEEIAEGGRVDAAVLGPSFGNEAGVRAAGALLAVDPGIHLVLAANVVTNRVLLAALQSGFADVVDTPLDGAQAAVDLVDARAPGPRPRGRPGGRARRGHLRPVAGPARPGGCRPGPVPVPLVPPAPVAGAGALRSRLP